jgi:hypothetical protein
MGDVVVLLGLVCQGGVIPVLSRIQILGAFTSELHAPSNPFFCLNASLQCSLSPPHPQLSPPRLIASAHDDTTTIQR